METLKVEFTISKPDEASMAELWEFLRFELEITGSMTVANPLSDGTLDQLLPRDLNIS